MADLTPPTPSPAAQDAPPTGAEGAKQQAADVASSAKEHASEVAATATDQAKTVAAEAAAEAKNLFADARQQLRSQADEQSQKVASALSELGAQLRQMADGGGSGVAKDLVASAADQADQVSRRLGEGGFDRTLEDTRRWARNRPGLFLGVAAAAGFVAARVARSADTDSLEGGGLAHLGRQRFHASSRSAPGPRPLASPSHRRRLGARSTRLGSPARLGAHDRRRCGDVSTPDGPDHLPTQPIESDQSLGELISRMTSDFSKLVGTQIELAKLEIKDEVAKAGKGAGMVGGGGLAAIIGVLLLSFAIAYWLADAFDNTGWGFFIVGLVYAVAAAVLVLKGKQKIKEATPVAEQTIETIKEDVAWARRQTS